MSSMITRRVKSLVPIMVFLSVVPLVVSCGTSAAPASPSAASPPTIGRTDASGTVWLCRPGLADNPCLSSLTTTVVRTDGKKSVEQVRPAKNPPIDCFYVYPTVSTQKTANANLHVDPEETAVAIAQASRFSQVCKVYAPMYPQLTTADIGLGGKKIDAKAAAIAYLGVLSAWKDYLAHDNHGRGVVLIGHSQGSSLLIPLIRSEIDPSPTERRLLVSALLMGGNVTVPVGQTVGGDFKNIPACQSNRQTGCVVAYSSFNTMPPANSLFGRVGTGIAAQSGLGSASSSGLQVLCTNPALLSGGTGDLLPYFVTKPFPGARGTFDPKTTADVSTPWVTYPDLYNATCENSGGASWLQVSAPIVPGDHRPVVGPVLGPQWGLHLVDVNIALGDLVALVGDQSGAYLR